MKRDDFNEGKKKDDQLNFTPLFSYSLEGITASIILDLRRPKDNNSFPLKYRVTHNRRQSYYPCMNMTVELYDKLHGDVRKREYTKTKKQIQDGLKRITDIIDELVKEGTFSLEGLDKRLSKGKTDSLITAFDNRIKELDDNGKVGSSVWYTSARNSIKKYTSKPLKFSDLTPEWLKKYETHLLDDGKEFTTVSIIMRAIRAIMNIGLRDGIITSVQYPFTIKNNGKYQIPEGEGRKIALSEAQLYDVIDYELIPDDEIYRDLWIFSFYCNGANIGDMLRFKYDDIKGNCIEWYRGKTIDTDKKKIKISMAVRTKRDIFSNISPMT
jgi:hypothetical protein